MYCVSPSKLLGLEVGCAITEHGTNSEIWVSLKITFAMEWGILGTELK
jgi:hypothetical protein